MPERNFTPNLTHMNGLRTVVYDAPAVPPELWLSLQTVELESIKARLPQEEWGRAATLVNLGNLAAYRHTRVNLMSLVGKEWNSDQLHRQAQVTVTFDREDPISGILTSNNTSADHLPKWLRPVEYWAKMLVPPGIELPTEPGRMVSHKRHVHVRSAYVMPGVQESLTSGESESPTSEVSGITLVGLYHALGVRHSEQPLAIYPVPDDPADSEMLDLTKAIAAQPTGDSRPNRLPGFRKGSTLQRVQANVGRTRTRIEELVGPEIIAQIPSGRYTKKEGDKALLAQARKEDRELMQEFKKVKDKKPPKK